KPKTCGFEVSVASVELHHDAKEDKNSSLPSFRKSCSELYSLDVSRRSSTSRAAQWGSLNALNGGSASINIGDAPCSSTYDSEIDSSFVYSAGVTLDSKPSGGLRGGELQHETNKRKRRRNLGQDESTRLCVSDDLLLGKSNNYLCYGCRAHSSLPLLTEELRLEELGHFTMRRTASVTSLPSLPDISSCGSRCRMKYAMRKTNTSSDRVNTMQQRSFGTSEDENYNLDTTSNSVQNVVEETRQTAQVTFPRKFSITWGAPAVDAIGEGKVISVEASTRQDSRSSGDSQGSTHKTNTGLSGSSDKPNLSRRRTLSNTTGRELITTKLTYTMVAVTVGFIVSYLPHLCVQIARGFNPDGVEAKLQTSSVFFVVYHLFVRSFFVNNAINPIIYGFYNDTFRRKGTNLLKSWAVAVLGEGHCGEKICLKRFRVWALRDLGLSSSHVEETG
ncbi:orexin receptor type 2, partial [Elysia marginata]